MDWIFYYFFCYQLYVVNKTLLYNIMTNPSVVESLFTSISQDSLTCKKLQSKNECVVQPS